MSASCSDFGLNAHLTRLSPSRIYLHSHGAVTVDKITELKIHSNFYNRPPYFKDEVTGRGGQTVAPHSPVGNRPEHCPGCFLPTSLPLGSRPRVPTLLHACTVCFSHTWLPPPDSLKHLILPALPLPLPLLLAAGCGQALPPSWC